MNTTPFDPYQKLAELLLSFFRMNDDGAHDLSHLERVWRNARFIQAEEGGDLEMIAAAVLLHDYVQVPKDSPMRSKAAALAADKARSILETIGWRTPRIRLVAEAIESHSFSAGLTPRSLEGRILQDADRLDAIGLTGVARCFYTAGRMGSALYNREDPAAQSRALDDLHFALDHFPNKLLGLATRFQTNTGRQLARIRERRLRQFYDGMLAEIGS